MKKNYKTIGWYYTIMICINVFIPLLIIASQVENREAKGIGTVLVLISGLVSAVFYLLLFIAPLLSKIWERIAMLFVPPILVTCLYVAIIRSIEQAALTYLAVNCGILILIAIHYYKLLSRQGHT